jgi:hypothetical protein
MIKFEMYPDFLDYFEYHGGTTIELIRKKADKTIWQDWILFDSVEAAFEYFNDCCGES